jgi:hypothetical protein
VIDQPLRPVEQADHLEDEERQDQKLIRTVMKLP